MKRKRWTRALVVAGVALALLYVLLLIPSPEPPPPAAGQSSPFAWRQDPYWSTLESRFVEAGKVSCDSLAPVLARLRLTAELILDSLSTGTFDPGDSLFSRLELSFFEMAPLVAACPARLPEYQDLFVRLRRLLKDRSAHWDMNSPAARTTLYRLLYGGRVALEEIMLQVPDSLIPALIMADDEPSATPSADLLGVTAHSGDLLVSRGGAPTSALIARGNDYPGNFSHVALLHVDEQTGRISIIESHIELGVKISTVDEYLNDRKLRVMVLRPRADHPLLADDPMLPHKAASLALARAQLERTPYDFEMNFRDHSRLFCSEVASAPYEKLGLHLWMGLSHLSSAGLRSWLAAFGVTHFETQEPSDLEYDPQLRVVAEWRDPETLFRDHVDNAVIDVMLEGAEAGEPLKYNRYLLPVARVTKAWSMALNLMGHAASIPEGMSATAALRHQWFAGRHHAIALRTIQLADEFRTREGYRPPYWELVKLARLARNELYPPA